MPQTRTLRLRGEQLSAFPETNGSDTLSKEDIQIARLPKFREISSAEELRDSAAVIGRLARCDWELTQEDTQYLSHDIHPYPAKFIPQLPGQLIAALSLPGELVFDPFGGSGTTALEAVRLGRRALSIDANPLGELIGRVKTGRLNGSVERQLDALVEAVLDAVTRLPKDPSDWVLEYAAYIPIFQNREHWFGIVATGELAFLRSTISQLTTGLASDIARLALSRIVLRVSYQDSETRYTHTDREIGSGEPLSRFLLALRTVRARVKRSEFELRYGVVQFRTADSRALCSPDGPSSEEAVDPASIDLIVTSPPYGNATDYHLYNRFRLLWLGYDPRALGAMEIGSHLRHQRQQSGFEAYATELGICLKCMYNVLKPGRFAALVLGNSVYSGKHFELATTGAALGQDLGFEVVGTIQRPIHQTKRSFVVAARRAVTESILILRRPPSPLKVKVVQPHYRLFQYEKHLRRREIEALLHIQLPKRHEEGPPAAAEPIELSCDPYDLPAARRLAFAGAIEVYGKGIWHSEPTWQSIVENGLPRGRSSRKDPKYLTHGLHPFKGKFYPQLAKALLNITGMREGDQVLDPFCGSGTTLLEGRLNGLMTAGCDLNPLAAQIARVKLNLLDEDPSTISTAVRGVQRTLVEAPTSLPSDYTQFRDGCLEEVENWFPKPVVAKLNFLLGRIRSETNVTIREFLEIVLSSVIREVSQQDPADLRIRRRKLALKDADLFGLFSDRLKTQFGRLEKFWSVRGYKPAHLLPAAVVHGDSREDATFVRLGLAPQSVDLVMTSPPYAMALPYIDTDRLSLLLLLGLSASRRRPVEQGLTGSREIATSLRNAIENRILQDGALDLPDEVSAFIRTLAQDTARNPVGFRRRNMPALLVRFFQDMGRAIDLCSRLLKPGGEFIMVIGDSKTEVSGQMRVIPTTRFLELLALRSGLDLGERIPIDVTTENLRHMRHAITENTVLRLKRAK